MRPESLGSHISEQRETKTRMLVMSYLGSFPRATQKGIKPKLNLFKNLMSIYQLLALFVVSLRLCSASWQYLPEDDAEMLQRFVNLTGGEEHLPSIINQIEQAASQLYNGTPCHMDTEWLHGAYGMVAPISFNDGVKWAVKVSEYELDTAIIQAMNVVRVIKQNCPAIPIPGSHGEIQFLENNTHVFYFMDWLEGIRLDQDPQCRTSWEPYNSTINTPIDNSVIVTLPETIVTDLAQFVYNLTMCPIPESECKYIFDIC
jgi:hypothetical protein